jgi:hypothetical protein
VPAELAVKKLGVVVEIWTEPVELPPLAFVIVTVAAPVAVDGGISKFT